MTPGALDVFVALCALEVHYTKTGSHVSVLRHARKIKQGGGAKKSKREAPRVS